MGKTKSIELNIDINKINLDLFPIAISPLSIDDTSQKKFKSILDIRNFIYYRK